MCARVCKCECVCTYVCVCACVYTYVCVHVCAHTCACACVRACMLACFCATLCHLFTAQMPDYKIIITGGYNIIITGTLLSIRFAIACNCVPPCRSLVCLIAQGSLVCLNAQGSNLFPSSVTVIASASLTLYVRRGNARPSLPLSL